MLQVTGAYCVPKGRGVWSRLYSEYLKTMVNCSIKLYYIMNIFKQFHKIK